MRKNLVENNCNSCPDQGYGICESCPSEGMQKSYGEPKMADRRKSMEDRRQRREKVSQERRSGVYVYKDEVDRLADALGVPYSNLQSFINERAEEIRSSMQGGR